MLAKHWLMHHRHIVHLLTFKMCYFLFFSYSINTGTMSITTVSLTFMTFGFFYIVAIVTVNTDPVHLSASANFILTYNRNVIFYITCNDTRTATCTGIQINCHYPIVTRFFVLIPKIVCFMFCMVVTRSCSWILFISFKSSLTDDITPFKRMVSLCLSQFISFTGCLKLYRCCIF